MGAYWYRHMNLGKVIGTVVCTRKDERLEGLKLLVVRTLDIQGKTTDSYVVAVDTVQAGYGDTVLTVSGSSGRQTNLTEKRPVDAAIIGIVDAVQIHEGLL